MAVLLVSMPSIINAIGNVDYLSPIYRYIVPNIDT
jgi:hypothetical protein